MRFGFLVSLLATFPLQMGPFRDSLWKLLFRQQLQVRGALQPVRSFGGWWAPAEPCFQWAWCPPLFPSSQRRQATGRLLTPA